MKRPAPSRLAGICLVLRFCLNTGAALDTNRISDLTGLTGAWSAAEGVFKLTAPLETALGHKAQVKDGMVKFVIGREAKMPCGCAITKEMGVNSWAAFAGTDDNAAVDGDFAARAAKLDKTKPVLVNRHAGIRGARAAALLMDLGFDVKNLEGGLTAWEAAGNKPVK